MAVTRGAKRAALLLASALLVAAPATAHATSGTLIGPANLALVDDYMPPDTVSFSTLDQAGSTGQVTDWSANFDCVSSPCTARLLVLAPTGNGSVFDVQSASSWQDVSGGGVKGFATSQTISGADQIAVETSGGALLGLREDSSPQSIQYGSFSTPPDQVLVGGSRPGDQALVNVDYDPKMPTETDVSADPSPVTVGDQVTYTANVTEQSVGYPVPPVDGDVEFKDGSTVVSGCSSVTLVDNVATCTTTATVRGHHEIEADYLGDSAHLTSGSDTGLSVRAPSTVTPVADPSPVARHAAITYRATVSPVPYYATGAGTSNSLGYGSIEFYVDGVVVGDCSSQPVNAQGVATCSSTSPVRSGSHALHVEYSGGAYNAAAAGDGTFDVIAPSITAPDVDFGGVTVGRTATRTVTFSNSENERFAIAGDALTGSPSLAIVSDGCVNTALAAGASCDVTVAYTPADTSAAAGAVTLTDDTGAAHAAALAGHGVAPATTPTPPATPTPAKPAVFDPGSKPQLTVTVTPSSGNGGTPQATVKVPLQCPALETCDLDGDIQVTTADFAKAAHTSTASATTVARFSKVSVAPGQVKTIKLHLSPAFIKKAQKAGVRRIHAVLTIHTTLGSGQTLTSQQHVTVILPRAAKKKAAHKVAPHFTG